MGIVVIMILLLLPMTTFVRINKSHIDSIKPFAGTINGELVGTDLCVKYWLDRENQPEVASYIITYPLGLSVFGYIYNTKQL